MRKKIIFFTFIFMVLFILDHIIQVKAENAINIENVNYDLYTNKDDFDFEDTNYLLDDYVKSLITTKHQNTSSKIYACNTSIYETPSGPEMSITGDDPIVSIIPKELFKTPNIKKIHIGKEYGFFIKTKVINNNIYSNVFLFDIVNEINKTPSHYKFIVKPLFQREYVYYPEPIFYISSQTLNYDTLDVFGEYDKFIMLNITKNDVVSPLPYFCFYDDDFLDDIPYEYFFAEKKEFYLTDVKNVINIVNEQHLNYGQENYDFINDKGKFIIQQDIEYQAKVYNVNDNAIYDQIDVLFNTGIRLLDSMLIDQIPGGSYIQEVIETAINLNIAGLDEINIVENCLTYRPKYSTADAQISNYGYLAKSSVSTLKLDDTNGKYGDGSYLFYDNNDYISFDYQLSYTPILSENGFETPWETRIIRGLSLKFKSYDDAESFEESDIYNFIDKNEDEREYKDLTKDNIINILPNGENLFKFTPDKSGNYIFRSNNALYVPNIEIFNYDTIETINRTDVKLNIYLQKNKTYYIRITIPNLDQLESSVLDYEFISCNLNLGDNSIEQIYDEYCYKFVPENTAYYKISINGEVLSIYNENMEIQSTYSEYYSILNKNSNYYVVIEGNDLSEELINIVVEDRMEILFYNSRIDENPELIMHYSTINPSGIYIPTKAGYNFICWETYDGSLVENINDYINTTLSLYAKWEPIIYYIYYYGINNELILTETYTLETGFNLNNNIFFENYIILSWQDSNGNVLKDSFNYIGDLNCFPNYVKEKSIITFDVNSKITDNIPATLSNNITQIELIYGECKRFPIPSISGFEFDGWYNENYQVTDKNGQMFSNVTFKDDTKLLAKWIRTEYYFNIETRIKEDSYEFYISLRNLIEQSDFVLSISDVNNDKFDVCNLVITLEEFLEEKLNEKNLTLNSFKPGYYLVCFTSLLNDIESRVHEIELDSIKNGVVLYPYFKVKEYTIKLCEDLTCIKTINMNFEYLLEKKLSGEPCFILETNRIGYIYDGFYTGDGIELFDKDNMLTDEGLEFIKILPNNNITTVSRTSVPIKYTIKYDANGGTGNMSSSEHTYGEPSILLKKSFTKTGYDFVVWSTKPSGNGNIYYDEQEVSNLTCINGDVIILYAQWELTKYNILYYSNNGSNNYCQFEYEYCEEIIIKDITDLGYSKYEHDFLGWSMSSNGEVEYISGDKVTNLGNENVKNVNLYAIWKIKTYQITYMNLLTNMYKPNLTSYTYGTIVNLPTSIDYSDGISINTIDCTDVDPTDTIGFYGWYEDANFTIAITQISSYRTGNICLYAKYIYTEQIYSKYQTFTVVEDDDKVTKILISNNTQKYISLNNGVFSEIKIELDIRMREIQDGYQEIKLYLASDDNEIIIFENKNYEYGGSGKNSTYYTITFSSKEKTKISDLAKYKYMYLELAAHGTGSDDWEVSYISVDFIYSHIK